MKTKMKTFTLELTLPTILELIKNSDNPEIATALIEGTYVEPVIPSSVYNTAKEQVVSFVSFDKWRNKVTFSFIKYKWHNEDKTDYSFTKSAKYCIQGEGSISQDSIELENWIGYFNAMQDKLADIIEAPKDYEKLGEFIAQQADLTEPKLKVTE